MQVNTNYNPQFMGLIKVKNLKNGEAIIEKETTLALDKGFEDYAFKNIFEGNWADCKKTIINYKKLKQYMDILSQTLGIHFPKISKDTIPVKLKHFNHGYSIKANKEIEITHIHDDFKIFD